MGQGQGAQGHVFEEGLPSIGVEQRVDCLASEIVPHLVVVPYGIDRGRLEKVAQGGVVAILLIGVSILREGCGGRGAEL